MNLDRFKPPCECSMKHEKPESFPDDYKPQCEYKQTVPISKFGFNPERLESQTQHWFAVGYAERKPNGTITKYIVYGELFKTFDEAETALHIIRMDSCRRGKVIPRDDFCVIEHSETFYMV